MNKVYLDDNLFYIEDFISKEDLSAIHKGIEADSFIEDYGHMAHTSLFLKDKYLVDIWQTYLGKLDNLFNTTEEKLIRPYEDSISIIKYRDIDFSRKDLPVDLLNSEYVMLPHADDVSYDLSEKELNERKSFVSKGIVIFITDDFDGGEVVYVNKDISIKPKAGTLVCHPGTKEYSHAVNKFYNGDRIIASMFVHKML
jgi:hypothetical protein